VRDKSATSSNITLPIPTPTRPKYQLLHGLRGSELWLHSVHFWHKMMVSPLYQSARSELLLVSSLHRIKDLIDIIIRGVV
jgi:hypothetical protein